MPTSLDRLKPLKRVRRVAVLLLLAGCAAQQQLAAVPPGPLPPGQARIWFYGSTTPRSAATWRMSI